MTVKTFRLAMILLLTLPAVTALPLTAATTLSIRLVQTIPDAESSPELADVLPALRRTLAAQGFRLRASRTIRFPARAQVPLAESIVVHCHGDARNLDIRVFRGDRPLTRTRVNLKDAAPLVLGGYQADDGSRLLIVFVAH